MYMIFLITVEQTIRYVGSLSHGTAREHAMHGRPTPMPGTSCVTTPNIKHIKLPEFAIY